MTLNDDAGQFSKFHSLFVFHLGIAVALAWLTSFSASFYAPWVRNIRPLLDPNYSGTCREHLVVPVRLPHGPCGGLAPEPLRAECPAPVPDPEEPGGRIRRRGARRLRALLCLHRPRGGRNIPGSCGLAITLVELNAAALCGRVRRASSPGAPDFMNWRDYWNQDTPIYSGERHKLLHYRLVANDIIALIPSREASRARLRQRRGPVRRPDRGAMRPSLPQRRGCCWCATACRKGSQPTPR